MYSYLKSGKEALLKFEELIMFVSVRSMLLNNPKQRCSAETALLSPFFSIPFGMLKYIKHPPRVTCDIYLCV